MLDKIDGLPAHVLLIHVMVVGVPVIAVMLILGVLWPAARRKFGFLTPLGALGLLVLTPITTSAGEWLLDQMRQNFPGGKLPAAYAHHQNLGDWVWPWTAGIFVMSAIVWWTGRMGDAAAAAVGAPGAGSAPSDEVPSGGGGTAVATRPRTRTAGLPVKAMALPTPARVIIGVLSIAVAIGGIYWIYETGSAGAHLTWGNG